jgi:hypothetical protein
METEFPLRNVNTLQDYTASRPKILSANDMSPVSGRFSQSRADEC